MKFNCINVILLSFLALTCAPEKSYEVKTKAPTIKKISSENEIEITNEISAFYNSAVHYSPVGYSFTANLTEEIRQSYHKLHSKESRFKYAQFRESLYLIIFKYQLSTIRSQGASYDLLGLMRNKDSTTQQLSKDLFQILFRNETYCLITNDKNENEYLSSYLNKCENFKYPELFLTSDFFYVMNDSFNIICKSPFREIIDDILKEDFFSKKVRNRIKKCQ